LKVDVERAKGVAANAEFKVVPQTDHMTAFGHPMFLQSMQQFLSAAN